MDGDTFTLISSTTLTGTFNSVVVLNGTPRDGENSRSFKVDLVYSSTALTATIVPATIAEYNDWRDLVFDEAQAADETISGPDANPDGDNMSNGDEALFGGDPQAPDGSPVSFELGDVDAVDGIQISATFNVADGITDREWLFESSPNMKDWSDAAVTEMSMQDMGDFSQMTVEFDQRLPIPGVPLFA